MVNISTEFLNKLEISKYILNDMAPAERLNILDKYDRIADAVINKTPGSVFSADADNYGIILNENVFNMFIRKVSMADMQNYQSLANIYKIFQRNLSNNAQQGAQLKNSIYKSIYKEFCNKIAETGVPVSNTAINTEMIQVALKTFGLNTVDEPIETDILPEDIGDDEDNPNFEFDDAEEFDIDELLNGDEADDYEEEPEDDSNEEEFDIDEILNGTSREEEETSEEPEEMPESEEDTHKEENIIPEEDEDAEPKEESELYKKLERELGSFLTNHVNSICNVLSALYSGGFTRAQAGILIDREGSNSPLVSIRKLDNDFDAKTLQEMGVDVTESDRQRGYKTVSLVDEGTFQDRLIYDAIKSCVPQLGKYIYNQDGGSIPDVQEMLNQDAVCYKLHLQFQSANIDYCTKENSEIKIKDWVKETQLKKTGVSTFTEWRKTVNDNKRRLKSYKSMVRPWYEWAVKKILIKSLIDAGITDSSDIQKIGQIINKITTNLRNVVVMSVRSTGAEYEVKVSSSITSMEEKEKMKEAVVNALSSRLNLAGSSEIVIKEVAKESFNSMGVLTLSIVLDQKKANAATIFAGDIINEIKNEDRPSWSHALLGMTEDRQWLYWDDFMNPAKAGPDKRAYTIYAASRAGKGNMTAALLGNAICDGRKVYYTDGKPETGPCLGEIAWLTNTEAYVFDGRISGSAPFSGYMEDWTNGLRRQSDVIAYLNKLPTELFMDPEFFNHETQQKFLGVMRYLKSMALCAAIITARNKGELPIDNWDIWIFDEMTQMSMLEAEVRETFLKYFGNKGVKGIRKDKSAKGNDILTGIDKSKFDQTMVDPSSDNFDAGVKYIYDFLNWTDGIVRSMGEAAVISLGKSSTNIVFIFQNASWLTTEQYSTTIGRVVMSMDCTRIVGNGGLAPACKNYGEESTRKKPWYTDTVNTGRGWWAISKSPDVRTAEMQVFKPFSVWTVPIDPSTNARSTAPGESRDPKYLYGYILGLCEAFGVDAAAILNTAYTYAGTAVQQFGFADSLEEYMYDASNLSVGDVDVDYESLREKRERASREATSSGEEPIEIDSPNTVVRDKVSFEDEEDEEPLDFGSYDNDGGMPPVNNTPTDMDMPIPGNKVNNIGEQQSIEDEHAASQLIKETQQIKNLKLITTQMLIRANYSDRVLTEYLDKVLNKPVTISGTNTKKPILENNLYNYANRNPREFGGLKLAAITFSSLVYIQMQRNLIDLSDIKNQAIRQIRSLNDTTDKWKFMLGMIEDYETSALANDEMPSEDRMRYYQQKFALDVDMDSEDQYIDNGFMGDDQFNSEDDYWQRMQSVPEEDIYDGHDVFKNNKNGFIDIKPRETQNAVRLNLDDYLEASAPSWSTMERFKKKLFESKNGIAYEFKKRWDYVLKEIGKKYPDKALVRRMAFSELQVAVNGRISMFNNLIGGEDEILITDILRIRDTFKKFPFIQEITFDGPTTQCLIDEYGTSAQEIWSIFQENRALKTLIISVNNNIQRFDRATFANTADKLNGMLGLQVTKMQLENFASEYNPRLENKSPGYINRIIKNGTSKASSWFKKSKKPSRQHPIVSKRTKVALGAAGLIAVGAVIGLPGILAAGITGTFGYFKGRS